MLIIKENLRFYRSEKILFPSADYLHKSESDVIKYLRLKQPANSLNHSICYTYQTLFSDLSIRKEEILERFSRTTRQQIKKCMRDETIPIKIDFYTHQELQGNESIITDLQNTFLSYCDHSSNPLLKRDYREKNVKQYVNHKCILVSKAEFTGGKVYHLYAWNNEDSLFEYLASDYLNEDVTGILAGMANKFLVYKDMLWLKDQGVLHFDWGGIFSFDNPNGIDRFKMQFGGRPAKVYSYFSANTMKGKILVKSKGFRDYLAKAPFRVDRI